MSCLRGKGLATTAEHLERMTDRGKFEILANAVLRRAQPEYTTMIALGINAQGETIRAPTDGFCRIPGSNPPHFIMFQHTTASRSELSRKWLSTNEEKPGDLIKSARRATQMRIKSPDAQFTVVLSTNQHLPDGLAEDAEGAADERGIGIDIWEQSRYVDFLDNHPEGHYLRREYLHIEAEMLSADLLAELGRESLAEYAKEEFQLIPPKAWVPRELDARIVRSAENSDCAVLLLAGDAGFGKSAAAYHFLDKHIAAGGYGLRIPESIAQASTSLSHMLRQALESLYPTLAPDETDRIPDIIPPGDRFVVLVDDVNRTSDPPRLISKLAGWATETYLIICPMWPRFRASLVNLERRRGIHTVPVERMRPDEATSAVQTAATRANITVSVMEAKSIALSLGYDPFLIGVLGQLVADAAPGQRLDEFTREVLALCIQRRISEAADAPTNQWFPLELEDALIAVTSCLLKHRKDRPTWADIESWLQQTPKHLDALRNLCRHSRLCYISGEQEFRFLHDRFLQYFCVESIKRFFDDLDAGTEVLFEPHYAELIGQALLRTSQHEELLNAIQDSNPLALVSTVRYMGAPSSDYHRLLVKKVREWVRTCAGPYSSMTPESLRWAVANSFLITDSSAVLDIVNTDFGLRYKAWLGGFVRFRNGDPRGALRYCSIFGLRRERDRYLFDQLVEHAALHHHEALVQGLAVILESAQERPDIDGAPILAGFLGFPELHGAVQEWWIGVSERPRYLVEALWAALRCSENPQEDKFLDSVVAYWAELPDVAEEKRASKRESVGERLCAALPPYVDSKLLRYLVDQADEYEVLRIPIVRVCCNVDLPDAVEFALRASAGMPDRERPRSSWGWPSVLGTKLSCASVTRLRSLWGTLNNSQPLRTMALNLWLRNVDRERVNVAEEVRTLTPDDPLFRNAIWERARLQDKSCVPQLVSLLESDTSLFQIAHRVWSDQILAIADKHLHSFQDSIPADFSGGTLDPHWYLADLLMHIPTNDASSLLEKRWSHLRYSRLFVQSALYVGTRECIQLVDTVIAEYPEDSSPFEQVSSRFGFLSPEKSDTLTLDHLKRLGQYWRRFDESTLKDFANACYQFGNEGGAWCKEHLPQPINEMYRKQYCPSDDDLEDMLDGMIGSGEGEMAWRVHEMPKYTNPRRLMRILRGWLETKPTLQKAQVAITCIEEIGQREDLDMLDDVMAHIEHRWMIEAQVEGAKFSVRRRTLR